MLSEKPFRILKSSHTGITVTSLSSSLKFWVDLLGGEVLYQRSFTNSPNFDVQGIPDAEFSVAMISIGGYNVELLEYTKPEGREVYRPRACDVGSVHVALDVVGTEALVKAVEELGWKLGKKADGKISTARRADGSMWSFVYVYGPDGETVEFMEKLDD